MLLVMMIPVVVGDTLLVMMLLPVVVGMGEGMGLGFAAEEVAWKIVAAGKLLLAAVVASM